MYGNKIYCSPELFNLLKNKSKDFKGVDLAKNDSFCLGMCLLEAGTMDNIQNCYNQKSKSFDAKALQ